MERNKKKKLWIVVAAAALIVVVLVILSLTQNLRDSKENRIQLPTDTAADSAQTEFDTSSRFAEITPDNVQTIIEGLARPLHYHQVLEIAAEFDSVSRTQSVEVWKTGEIYRISSEEPSGTRNILTDGQTLYLWYDGDSAASQISLDSSIIADDLIGVPTYEDILSTPKEQIEEANFVVLAEPDNTSCVFICTAQEDASEYYWVSLSSGLLCKQTSLYQNAPLRTVKQTALEVYAEEQSFPEAPFTLPDGSLPFAIRK